MFEQNLFDTLPDKIRRKIFFMLESHQDKLNFRFVSRSWKMFVDKIIPLSIFVDNNNFKSMFLYCNSASYATVENFTLEFNNISKIAFSNTLRSLEFKRIIPVYNVLALLKKCDKIVNLKFVQIVLDKVSGPEKTSFETIQLPLVKSLEFSIKSRYHSFSVSDKRTVELLAKVQFGSLQTICITVQNVRRDDELLPYTDIEAHTQYLVQSILLSNQNTEYNQQPEFLPLLIKNSATLKSFHVRNHTYDGSIWKGFGNMTLYSKDDLELIQLEKLSCVLSSTDLILFQSQRKLKYLRIYFNVALWNNIQSVIMLNQESLTFICLHAWVLPDDSNAPLYIDLSIFAECTQLKNLYLMFFTGRKTHANKLPTSLENLSMHGILTYEDILDMAASLTKLKHFTLESNFDNVFTVIDIKIVKKFLLIPTLRKLFFRRCKVDIEDIYIYCQATKGLREIIIPWLRFLEYDVEIYVESEFQRESLHT